EPWRHPRHGRASRHHVRGRHQQGRAGDQGSQRPRHSCRRSARFEQRPVDHRLPGAGQRRCEPRDPSLYRCGCAGGERGPHRRRPGEGPGHRRHGRAAGRDCAGSLRTSPPARGRGQGRACSIRLSIPTFPPPAPPESGRGVKGRKMAEITAASVKELRERTGAVMMDCKKALAETNGEMEAAIDWLRAKGLAAAAKKAGRTAAEGLVGVIVEGNRGALVEVNSETDFVAKNELFQDFVRNVAKLALEHGTDVEALGAAQYPGGGTVQEKLTDNIA